MKNICIYASELAIITGHNKYEDIGEIILKLWKRNYNEDYDETVKYLSKILNTELKEESPEEYLEHISKKNNIKNVSENLNECLKSSNVKELQTKQQTIIKQFESLDKSEKKKLKECIIKKTNTNFGTKYENSAIVKYMEQTGDKVNTVNKFFKKELFQTKNNLWSIGGKIDGIIYNDDKSKTLVEVKNRVSKLFYTVRDYEKVQILTYMNILGLTNAKLVESLKKDNDCNINIINIEFDYLFWENEVENKLAKFIKNFEKIMRDETKKIELLKELFRTDA